MKLTVKSRRWVRGPNGIQEPHVVVSIFTPGDEPAKVTENEHTQEVLRLCFDDLDRVPGHATAMALGNPILFTSDHAWEVCNLLRRHPGVEAVLVHCDAGVSRSAGVAAALGKHFNGDDSEFFSGQRGPYTSLGDVYRPNMRVYRLMLNELAKFDDDVEDPRT